MIDGPCGDGPGVAVVTGAASGLGQAAARRLVGCGWRVAGVDKDPVVEAGIRSYRCDVGDAGAVDSVIASVESELGPVRRLVHAAGVASSGLLSELSAARIRRVCEVNYFGTVNTVGAVLPGMRERGAGEIVLFGSIGGWIPVPGGGAYAPAKAAVHMYAEVLALECAGLGIRVVCACPAMVETPMLHRIRASAPELFGDRAGVSPEVVLDSIERGLARGALWSFPDRATRAMWTVHRVFPAATRGLVARKVLGGRKSKRA